MENGAFCSKTLLRKQKDCDRSGVPWTFAVFQEHMAQVNFSLAVLKSITLFKSVSLFLFVNKFICMIFFDAIYKWYYMIFYFFCLTSFNMTVSRSIHVAANDIISFFLVAE